MSEGAAGIIHQQGRCCGGCSARGIPHRQGSSVSCEVEAAKSVGCGKDTVAGVVRMQGIAAEDVKHASNALHPTDGIAVEPVG